MGEQKIEAVHLADIIQDEMKERGWNLDRLVMEMGPHYTEHDWGVCKLSWELFFDVRDKDIVLGDVMATQLCKAFDIDPQFFINIHEQWRKQRRPFPLEDKLREAKAVARRESLEEAAKIVDRERFQGDAIRLIRALAEDGEGGKDKP